MPRIFYAVLANSLVAFLTNTFVWFAVTFWVYLETESVIATSIMAGVYTVIVAVSGFFLGSLVDRYPKQRVMLLSSVCSLVLYALALAVFSFAPASAFTTPTSATLWVFVLLTLVGAIVGNVRAIALSTIVTVLVPEADRDRANGMVGTSNGVGFLGASVLSGLAIGFIGVAWMLATALVATALTILHLSTLAIPSAPAQSGDEPTMPSGSLDLAGTIKVIRAVPGLLGLIFFQTFNNFLGGIYMALMDAYGLLLVSVQVWGTLWGVLSLGFIVGGLAVSRLGLGRNPLRTLLLCNAVMWSVASVFTLQAWIVLLALGMFTWLCLAPVAEAAEQTILQKVTPPERQGRVFGFAQSIEQAASPITAFLMGPIAELLFIPFMTTGSGVELLGAWFGTGKDRGLALLFTVSGAVGLVVTLLAMQSRAYRQLSAQYRQPSRVGVGAQAS
jgi:DHA3 family multidrug efflux protein-like MFS transporter